MTTMGLDSWYRAAGVLESLAAAGEPLGVAALAEQLALPKSTVARYLNVLGELGFVRQAAGETRYTLGPTLYVLGRAVPLDALVRDAARPHLVTLTEHTGETSVLAVVSGNEAVCVEKIESTHAMRLTARVGERVPLHCGGTPRCLLAYLPDAEREAYLARPLVSRSPGTITDPDALSKAAAETRQHGYVVSRGELDDGMVSIAAPIWDGDERAGGRVVAAISIAGPELRLTESRLPETVAAVRAAAKAISARWRDKAREGERGAFAFAGGGGGGS